MKKYIKSAPDPVTSSGYVDMYMNRVNSAISRLKLDDLSWDVKGNKFTLRLPNKTVVITYSNRQAKIQKVNPMVEVKIDITTNGGLDITRICRAIRSI